WNLQNSEATSYTVKTTTEIPEIKSLADSLLKSHQLGPHTPMKKERRRVINVDDEPDKKIKNMVIFSNGLAECQGGACV
ncbi:hypothetical protein FRX31_034473, partial [Thalictrum thalictroides]